MIQLLNPMVPFSYQPLPLTEAVRILHDRTYPCLPKILYKVDAQIPPSKSALEFDLKENYNQVTTKEELIVKLNKIIKEKLAFTDELPMELSIKR